jgi:hypothetical protein
MVLRAFLDSGTNQRVYEGFPKHFLSNPDGRFSLSVKICALVSSRWTLPDLVVRTFDQAARTLAAHSMATGAELRG